MSILNDIDKELDSLVAGVETPLAALYRKLPQAEPDARLDAAVLAMAHAAARSGATRPGARRSVWLVGLGSAAGVVLAAGLAWRVQQDGERASPAAPPAGSAPQAEVVHVTPITIDVAPATQAPAPQAAPAATSEAAANGRLADAPESRPVAKERSAVQPTKPAPPPAPPAEPPKTPVEKQRAPDYTVPYAPAGAVARPVPFPTQDTAVDREQTPREPSVEQSTTSAPAAMAGPALPATAPERPVGIDEHKDATTRSESSRDVLRRKAEASRQAEPVRSAPAVVSPTRSATLLRNSRLYPESWIAEIRRLVGEGRRDEARENLDLFRRKYPTYHLPADMQALADAPR